MKKFIAVIEKTIGFKYVQYDTLDQIQKDMLKKDYVAVYELKLKAKTELKEVVDK